MPPVPPLKEWNCRKCNAPQRGGQVCKDCGASKRPNGGERRKADKAAALEEARLAGNLWGAVELPPITQGVEQTIEWLNQVNVAIDRAIEADFPDTQKIRVLQDLIKAVTKGKHRENAPHRERLLQARQQREGTPYVEAVTGDVPPHNDLMALPLYYFFRLARAIYEAAQVQEMDDETARKFRARATTATAGIYLREQHRAEAFCEEHGIKDIHKVAIDTARIWPVIETANRPALQGEAVLFTANPGPQSEFVDSPVDEILYGGRAGGGKSAGLLIAAIDHLLANPNPKNHAIIFRRSLTESKRQSYYKMAQIELGKLARRGYPIQWRGDEHVWDLGQFGRLEFGYLETMQDALRYQGAEYSWIGVDEATHIDPEPLQFVVRTRLRKGRGVPSHVRYTSNPGGPHHRWFFERWAPWLNTRADYLESGAPIAAPGEVLYYIVESGKERWVPEGTAGAKSRTYIPATVENTPQYDAEDYQRQLDSITDPLLRAQMQNGDWSATYAKGIVFRPEWFKIVDTLPSPIARCVRSYDMAWGVSESAAWTVGTLLAELVNGQWAILDVIRVRGSEGTTAPMMREVAAIDGKTVPIRIPADMGAAGSVLREHHVRELSGFDVRLVQERGGKKCDRARPFAAQAEYGNLLLLRGSHPSRKIAADLFRAGVTCSTNVEWITGFVEEVSAADPDKEGKRGYYFDQMDSAVGAFEFLTLDRSALPAPGSLRGASEVIQRAFGVGTHAAPPAASWAPSVARGGGGRRTGMI